jgi:hypothetical protein
VLRIFDGGLNAPWSLIVSGKAERQTKAYRLLLLRLRHTSITESWHITTIQDNTPQPKFFGTGTTTAISGDAAFLAAFGPVGTTDTFDWIEMPLACTTASNCTTLDRLATTTASASAPISSGEKLTSAVPEPMSLALLGSALFGLGWVRWGRKPAV